ncbi:hypothetical protein PAAL109150_24760 [Paenibacillus alkaliterrae]
MTLDHEKDHIRKGELALIPAMVPHNVRNIGSETLKVIGFFSSPNVESTFAEPLMPINQRASSTYNQHLESILHLN